MIKFSLILPVYNVECFLSTCLDSCINQDLPEDEYEILVVIDGATDNSEKIANHYSKRNSNIAIISKSNGGLSDARNAGLLKAKGKYIWFIDSDDYIQANVLKSLYIELEQNSLECLWIKWQDVDNIGNILPFFEKVVSKEDYSVLSGKEFMRSVLATYLPAWSFIYSKDFLYKNKLLFTKGMYYEDADFAYRSLPLLEKIKMSHQRCYFYVKRAGSIISNTNWNKFVDICKNAETAHLGYRASVLDCGLANFYYNSYSAFFLFALKYCIKSREADAVSFLSEVVTRNQFRKVKPWGGFNAKFLALVYNVLGGKTFFLLLKLMSK